MRSSRKGLNAVLTLLALVIASVGLAACSDDDDDGSGSGDEAPKVAWLTAITTEFVDAEEQGARPVIEDAGGSLEFFDAQFDPQAQLKQCQDAITSGRFNSMVIYSVDSNAITPCVQQAADADIPVVAQEVAIGPDPNDVEPQVDGVVGSVIYPGVTSAEERWPLVEEACADAPAPCKIILSVAFRADPFNSQVLERFEQLADEAGYEIVQVLETAYDTAATQEAFPDALRANQDANVYIAEADNNAIAAAEIIQDLGIGQDIKIIGDGGSRPGVQAIKDGTLFGTVGLWPNQMGAAAAEMLIQAVNGETVDPSGINAYEQDEPREITKENVDEFTPEWG